MRRRGREGGEKGPSPPCSLLARWVFIAPEAQTLQQQQQQSLWGWGNREKPVEQPLPRAGRASSEGELVLLAALDLGFKHVQESGGE